MATRIPLYLDFENGQIERFDAGDEIDPAYATNVGGGGAFTDLSDVPASYAGQSLKVVRVNAGETALEFATIAGGGDLLAANNLSDLANAATARTNLGLNTTANQTDSADKRFMTDAQETKLDAISGTNTGDQTSIVGISGTKAQFDTACSDGNFLYSGDSTPPNGSAGGDLTGTYPNPTIANDAVTLTKLVNASGQNIFLARWSSGSGDFQEAQLGSGSFDLTSFESDGILDTISLDGYTIIVKAANQDVTNAGVTNDTHFTFPVVAGGHYMVMLEATVSGNDTTGDYIGDFQVSAGTMRGKGTCQNLTAAAAVQNIIITAAAAANTTAIVTGAPTANLDDLIFIRMSYSFTASADATFRYRFGNSVAAAGRTSRTWKGSIMKYKRLD